MAYAHTVAAPNALAFREKPARASVRSRLTRLLHFIEEANMRRADRAIARYLKSTGGKLTDATEREIENRYLSNVMR
jgi:hypothetical protein